MRSIVAVDPSRFLHWWGSSDSCGHDHLDATSTKHQVAESESIEKEHVGIDDTMILYKEIKL